MRTEKPGYAIGGKLITDSQDISATLESIGQHYDATGLIITDAGEVWATDSARPYWLYNTYFECIGQLDQ